MKDYLPVLRNTRLFAGVRDDEILQMTGCLRAAVRRVKREEYVYRAGEQIRCLAILAQGALLIQKDDYWGNRSIVSRIAPGEIFGEAYAADSSAVLIHDVIAVEDSTVLLFDMGKILHVCADACVFHTRIIQNLVAAISAKNRMLTQKIDYMSRRTTREKLTAYLSAQSRRQGDACFDIPFNRQQLADFLGVDRSAMSSELCKMRDDGMLTFTRNHFELIQNESAGQEDDDS